MRRSISMITLIFCSLFLIVPTFAQSDESGTAYRVTITNITKGQIFSPPIAVVHKRDISLFQLGQPASANLALMAEDGMAGPLAEELGAHELVRDVAVSDGPVMPGQSVTLEVRGDGRFNLVSVAGMLVTTNDTFFALTLDRPPSYDVFVKNGSSRGMAYGLAEAYDAGTEANSEDCAFIPGPPCGNGGVHDPAEAEGYVYISNGIHGIADINPDAYDWRSKVAVIQIERL
ncbi:spondin domain-containing protein [Acanthopleuribacter pedis]|uniref:Spondin domain-containing protein n=1 Tax=Acanthopleuribacter pedis TaxID=442870 RepID=A0A8J7QBZ9_9BACT|nr:spondin domain-containing protein [Acanthopleuribacter pedis]MBO1323347.1 spondin domain-containing protein [Acanthopleuribacter pedis]